MRKWTIVSTVIGNKGYISTQVQLDLFETANIRLEVPSGVIRKNGNRRIWLLPKQEKGLKPYSHNYVTSL